MKQQTLLSFFGKKKRSTDKENSAPKRAKPAAAEEAAASAPEAVVQETMTPAAAQDATMTEATASAQEEPDATPEAPDETEAEVPPAEEEAPAAPPAEAKEPPAPAEAEEPPAPAEAEETEAPTSTPPANPQHAGLSQYEIERLERIARNAQFMASLGLGDARDAFAAPSGLGAATSTKKKAGRRKPKPSRQLGAGRARRGFARRRPRPARRRRLPHAEATSAAFRPGDDHHVLTAGRDAAVKLWDLRAPGAPLRTFAGHHRPDARRKGIFHPRWVGGGAFAVGGEGSQRLAFYDAARGAAFASVKCAGDVTAVAPLPGGESLAVADDASGALALVPAPPRPSAP
ncbi:cullin associated factor [Aureococcus anophagefferens]|uniref:Cullin associated factor n=1 Tax=Aureococcus anophagefferens TaxID=44056 RepID=A0ABR1G7W9_AURAN